MIKDVLSLTSQGNHRYARHDTRIDQSTYNGEKVCTAEENSIGIKRCHIWKYFYRYMIKDVLSLTSQGNHRSAGHDTCVERYDFILFFFINMGVRASLRAPQLIPRALKLTTISLLHYIEVL
jgi:hypothetical protein